MWEISRGYGNQSVTAVPKAQINHDAPVLCTDFSTDGTVIFSGGASKQARRSATCAMRCMPRASAPPAVSAAGTRSTRRRAAALAVRAVVKHDALKHALMMVAACEFELIKSTPKMRVAVVLHLFTPSACIVYRSSSRRDVLYVFFFFIFQLAEPFRESAAKALPCTDVLGCKELSQPCQPVAVFVTLSAEIEFPHGTPSL